MGTTHEISRNLGGDRLGSGNKMEVNMHNYNRSNHDLSYAWRSTMNVGTLVPFMKLIEENGDKFSIDLNAVVKTIPTIGPLYGAFKLQLDIFECPIRLYNGLLHNNMTKIGMNMKDVKLPKVKLEHYWNERSTKTNSQINPSCLMKYLGISGIGDVYVGQTPDKISRKFNGVPLLAYWDIYKNYYANKQEEIGAFIKPKINKGTTKILKITRADVYEYEMGAVEQDPTDREYIQEVLRNPIYELSGDQRPYLNTFTIKIELNEYIPNPGSDLILNLYDENNVLAGERTLSSTFNDVYWNTETGYDSEGNPNKYELICVNPIEAVQETYIKYIEFNGKTTYTGEIDIDTFDLTNIDTARINILKETGLGNELLLNSKMDFKPYSTNWIIDEDKQWENNQFDQNGLGIKTYQSDLLQNWLNTEWIDGENGINAITAVDTSSGSFQIDALILANKVYNLFNRIAVSGGTYEDWQEAVFTANVNRRAETPVYKGGLACEICFDEVISTSATEERKLGELAGHAVMPKEGIRGGKIEITCNEPSYIMGIVSITPRIDYSQGNDWDMTELDTMDDLHKPALDGIGFEDLLQERAAWWGTYWDTRDTAWHKLAMGKTPAWLNYMTNLNKCFGKFADPSEDGGQMFMTLNRQYQISEDTNGIEDLTTYVDPRKFNYAFAETGLNAQNFWVQIGCKIEARRVMSAKILPNL